MKTNILPALKLTLILLISLAFIYVFILRCIALLAEGHGDGVTVEKNGKIIGFENIGQSFTHDNYFWSRPSAVGYNAAGSGGSNKGTSAPDFLKTVQARIDTFLVHNPGVKKSEIPAEMVTASGSGLDPDISPVSAYIQVARIAKIRKIDEARLQELIKQHTVHPLLGFLGPEKINVLKLNLALDQIKN